MSVISTVVTKQNHLYIKNYDSLLLKLFSFTTLKLMKYSRLTNYKIKRILTCSCEDLTLKGTTFYTNSCNAYNGLILKGYDHYGVCHSHNNFLMENVMQMILRASGAIVKESLPSLMT